MQRRKFIRTTGAIMLGLSLAEKAALAARPAVHGAVLRPVNTLPKWKGFNLLDYYSPDEQPHYKPSTAEHFKWMRDWGFNFARIPII